LGIIANGAGVAVEGAVPPLPPNLLLHINQKLLALLDKQWSRELGLQSVKLHP
jgi:hypothetical protein